MVQDIVQGGQIGQVRLARLAGGIWPLRSIAPPIRGRLANSIRRRADGGNCLLDGLIRAALLVPFR